MSRILIVDDEASICWAFREFLTEDGHSVDIAATAEEGLRLAETARPDAVVLDVRLPGMDGLSALPEFQSRIGLAPIVIVTAFGNLDTAVRAMEGGAFEYLVKPFDLDQAAAVMRRALESHDFRGQTPPTNFSNEENETLIGRSAAMQSLFKSIALVAPTDVPVLITGESGTGKELVARAIHRHSVRREGPFVPICLAALSPGLIERELFGHVKGAFTGAVQDRKGLLELASGGTVLLDEIGDVSPAVQVKLLRALEHRELTPVGDVRTRATDIRIIAATNRPLAELMASGQFRDDLFYRLSGFQIHLPPLRERSEDIPALAKYFLRLSKVPDVADQHLSQSFIDEIRSRPWAGNVRELRNAVEHAVIVARGRRIGPEHLPAPSMTALQSTSSDSTEIGPRIAEWARREVERFRSRPGDASIYERFLEITEPHLLGSILSECDNNRAKTADMLGIHRATLRQKLSRYNVP